MFWVGYNNLFMEPIFGPLTNDAWIPRWMAVTYFYIFLHKWQPGFEQGKTGLTKKTQFQTLFAQFAMEENHFFLGKYNQNG